jgi:hypothetical protein
MTSLRTMFALMLIIIVVLLAAGCEGQADVPQVNPVPSETQTGTGTYWIKIDPISDKLEGDKFSIIAITNLPVGNEVRYEITSMNFPLKNTRYENLITLVVGGDNGLNKTVIDIDSSELKTGQFVIFERAVWENAKDAAPFRLNRISYTIDFYPIGDKRFGDKFTVKGTTNLPAGDNVSVNIQSSNNGSSIITGTAMILKGNDDLNTTSFTVNTSNFLSVAYYEYSITERYSQRNISVGSRTGFRISDGSPRPFFISINPNIMVTFGYDGIFTSTTNLPVGDEVFWEIRSQKIPGVLILNGTAEVTKGKTDLNETFFIGNASVFIRHENSCSYILTEKAKINEV